MPHEVPGVFRTLLHHSRGLRQELTDAQSQIGMSCRMTMQCLAMAPENVLSANPATPSDHPEHEPAQQKVTAEINLDHGQGDHEQGGTGGHATFALLPSHGSCCGCHSQERCYTAPSATLQRFTPRMANGAIVHLEQASESICPHHSLEAGGGESISRNLLWQDSCRGVPRFHRGSAPNQSSLCSATRGSFCLR